MKSVIKLSFLAATVALAVGCNQEEAKAPIASAVAAEQPAQADAQQAFASEDDKAAYAIGASLAQYLNTNLDQQAKIGLNLNKEMVIAGVEDVFNGKPRLTQEQTQQVLQELDARVTKLVAEQQKKEAEAAVKAGEEFRAKFAKEKGVVTTDSGLMYKVDRMGDGPKPKATDTVVVDYSGTLIDGTKFDSSYDRGQPATFPLNRVIPGWTEGVQLMPVGSKFTFVIPADLAYGAQGAGSIPPNSTLKFEVELKEIKKADAPAVDAAPKAEEQKSQ